MGDLFFWFYIISGYFISRTAFIDGLIAPFGLALILALKKNNSSYLIPVFMGVLAGEFSRTSFTGVFAFFAITLLLFSADYYRDKLGLTGYSWWLAVSVIYAVINLMLKALTGLGSFEVYKIFFETGILLVAAMLFSRAVFQLEGKKIPRSDTREEIIPLVCFFALLLAGIKGITFFGFGLQSIIAGFIVLLISYLAGGGIGAACGAITGTVMILTDPSPSIIGAMTLGGYLSGVFNDFKKPGSVFGFLIGGGLVIFYLNPALEIAGDLRGLGASALMFLLIPGGAINSARKIIPLNYNNEGVKENNENYKFNEILKKRTGEISSLFKELSHTFSLNNKASSNEATGEFEDFMERVANNICGDCKRFYYCWEKNFFVIYRGIVETLSNLENKKEGNDGIEIENNDLSKNLIKHCMRPIDFKKDLKEVYEVFKIDTGWRKKIDESQDFVARQLEGISEFMENMTRELEKEMKNEEELENDIFNELIENNISVKSISVHKVGAKKVKVNVELNNCKNKDFCDRIVNHYISNLLGEKLMVVRNKCFHRKENDSCNFKLRPFKAYSVVTGISQLSGEKENTCGDSYLSKQLDSGQHLLLLSDGMGKGKKARGESISAVRLLEKMLNSGFNRDFVIKNVNTILNLKNEADTFATMDMALVDNLNGEGELYKAGAMPSYIIRKKSKEVEKIQGQSLPAGILDNVEPSVKKFWLTGEDTLVMVSDGVFTLEDETDWLEKELFDLKDTHPQVMADKLAEKVKRRFYGEIKDDVTIMVSKLKVNFKPRS